MRRDPEIKHESGTYVDCWIKFRAVSEGIRASVSPLGGSLCTRDYK